MIMPGILLLTTMNCCYDYPRIDIDCQSSTAQLHKFKNILQVSYFLISHFDHILKEVANCQAVMVELSLIIYDENGDCSLDFFALYFPTKFVGTVEIDYL